MPSKLSLLLPLVLVSLVLAEPTEVEIVEAADRLEVSAVAIVAITADGQVAKSPVTAVVHDPVTLHAVLKGREDGKDVAVADAAVIAAGAVPWPVPARPFAKPEAARLTWNKVEPQGREYWNTQPPTMKFSFKQVPYVETAFRRGRSAVVADAKPTTYDGNPKGYGTMRFQLVYERDGKRVKTPGASALQPTKRDNVFRVAYAGATRFPLINHALELCNVPYIFGSESPTQKDEDHQSEYSYGVDCADLVTYASRHSGLAVPYGFTGTFDPSQGRTKLVKRPAKAAKGVYLDAKGQPIRWGEGGVQPQDLVLFDGKQRHIGILYRDVAPKGVLDENDVIVHTLLDAPTFVKVSEAYDQPFSIVRLKEPTPVLAAAPRPLAHTSERSERAVPRAERRPDRLSASDGRRSEPARGLPRAVAAIAAPAPAAKPAGSTAARPADRSGT